MEFVGDKFKLYTKKNGLVTFKMVKEDFDMVAGLSDEELNWLIETNQEDYKYGLSFNEYLFTCLRYGDCIEESSIVDRNKFNHINQKYGKFISYVYDIDTYLYMNYISSNKTFSISPDLYNAVLENMSPDYSFDERVYYYYFKLCFLLEPDLIQNFCMSISAFFTNMCFLKSSNRISQIDTVNNQASCFEFDAIFSKLIEMDGGVVLINSFTGDLSHAYTSAIVNNCIHKFDAYNPPEHYRGCGRDIISVSLDEGYCGITIESENSEAYFEQINKIYNDVQNEFADRKGKTKFSDEQMLNCFDQIDRLNLGDEAKEDLKYYFNVLNCISLGSVSFAGFIYGNRIIRKKDEDWLKLTGVVSCFEQYAFNMVLSVRQEDDEFIYFVFGEDDTIHMYDALEIEDLILEKKIIINKNEMIDCKANKIISSEYRLIPGIDEELQKKMNSLATELILPICDDYFEDSSKSGDADRNKVNVKKQCNVFLG